MVRTTKFKEIVIIVVALLFIRAGVEVAYDRDYFSVEKVRYHLYADSMEQINADKLDDLMIQNDKSELGITVVYLGRSTCPSCVELMPKIRKLFQNFQEIEVGDNAKKIKHYYFDTEKNNDKKTRLLREHLNVEFVPTIVIFKEGNTYLFGSDQLELNDYKEEFLQMLMS